MVDISRDPRWGRVVEGAGEDPFLGSAMAAAKVRGYQGSTTARPNKMAATIKHFAAYGAPVAGREYNTVDMSTQQLFNDYLPPYKAAVDAGAATVMSSFNSLNGVPNTANPYTLTDDPARRVGIRRDRRERLPGRPGARGLRLRVGRRPRRPAGADRGLDIEMAVTLGPTTGNPVYDTSTTYGPQLLRPGQDHDGAAERPPSATC